MEGDDSTAWRFALIMLLQALHEKSPKDLIGTCVTASQSK